eukprot:CAMPEP_0118648508 /NCGR_PEP_ID=MMETSP0785-20121206/9194_1 /TAXON_ID=91992 /ORGANISM="Bolidomonas pacifica, Strain CCMP 1866" /LENGTH=36 /DNA_ID= /DNA_START= /DNA_END= /DNA_ORIENTATION=
MSKAASWGLEGCGGGGTGEVEDGRFEPSVKESSFRP